MPYLHARDYSPGFSMCIRRLKASSGEETARVKKSELISGKGFASVRGYTLNRSSCCPQWSVIHHSGSCIRKWGISPACRTTEVAKRRRTFGLVHLAWTARLDCESNHPRLRPRRSLDLEPTFHQGQIEGRSEYFLQTARFPPRECFWGCLSDIMKLSWFPPSPLSGSLN